MVSFSDVNKRKHTERFGQVFIYLGKLFRIFVNEKGWKVFPMAAAVSVIVAFVTNNVFVNMEGTLIGALAFACVSIWNGFFNSIQSVCKERPIIKREHRAGMHISSYIVANMIYQALLCIGQVVIQIIVYKLYGMHFPQSGLVTGFFVLDFGITLFLITYAADALALMVSSIVKSTTAAMTIVPFLLIIQLVFSGVAFELHGIADQVGEFTISKQGIRAICTVSNHNDLPSVTLYAAVNRLSIIDGVAPLVNELRKTDLWNEIGSASQLARVEPKYAYTKENIYQEWSILGAMVLVFTAGAIISLEFIDRDRR